jgi:DNA-binding GntR family transcriptional regulator
MPEPGPHHRPRRRSALVARLTVDHAGGPQPAILEELHRVILDGGVPPGTPIPVGEVAELFGVSPIPVREALKTLVGEGLVSHRQNAGYVVAQLTRDELTELYLVRGVLESAALRAAVPEATRSDVERAREAHAALDLAIERGDLHGYHRESRRFHLALIAPCRMRRLLHMFESAWNVTEPLRPMAHLSAADRDRLHADHRGMLDAYAAGDAVALVERSAAHHQRLESMIATLTPGSGLIGE